MDSPSQKRNMVWKKVELNAIRDIHALKHDELFREFAQGSIARTAEVMEYQGKVVQPQIGDMFQNQAYEALVKQYFPEILESLGMNGQEFVSQFSHALSNLLVRLNKRSTYFTNPGESRFFRVVEKLFNGTREEQRTAFVSFVQASLLDLIRTIRSMRRYRQTSGVQNKKHFNKIERDTVFRTVSGHITPQQVNDIFNPSFLPMLTYSARLWGSTRLPHSRVLRMQLLEENIRTASKRLSTWLGREPSQLTIRKLGQIFIQGPTANLSNGLNRSTPDVEQSLAALKSTLESMNFSMRDFSVAVLELTQKVERPSQSNKSALRKQLSERFTIPLDVVSILLVEYYSDILTDKASNQVFTPRSLDEPLGNDGKGRHLHEIIGIDDEKFDEVNWSESLVKVFPVAQKDKRLDEIVETLVALELPDEKINHLRTAILEFVTEQSTSLSESAKETQAWDLFCKIVQMDFYKVPTGLLNKLNSGSES